MEILGVLRVPQLPAHGAEPLRTLDPPPGFSDQFLSFFLLLTSSVSPFPSFYSLCLGPHPGTVLSDLDYYKPLFMTQFAHSLQRGPFLNVSLFCSTTCHLPQPVRKAGVWPSCAGRMCILVLKESPQTGRASQGAVEVLAPIQVIRVLGWKAAKAIIPFRSP